jgi:cytochrome c oxidase subunit 3
VKKHKVLYDVSHLPTFAYGARNPLWWGNIAFMVIEGLGFVFSIATYLYLYNQNLWWPLAKAPDLKWATSITVLFLLSEIPNVWIKRAAQKAELKKVQWGLIIMSLIGIVGVVLRCYEFTTLNVSWDSNAYGSIVWFLLGLHSVHLITDLSETIVMTVLMHIGPVDIRRFPEIEDNQDYWHFVVVAWMIVYVVLYWLPRWLEHLP